MNALVIQQFIHDVRIGQFLPNDILVEDQESLEDHLDLMCLVNRYTQSDSILVAATLCSLDPSLKFTSIDFGGGDTHYCVCLPVDDLESLYFDLNGLHTLEQLKEHWGYIGSFNGLNGKEAVISSGHHEESYYKNIFLEKCPTNSQLFYSDVIADLATSLKLLKGTEMLNKKYNYSVEWMYPVTLAIDHDLNEDDSISHLNDNISVQITTSNEVFEVSRRFVIAHDITKGVNCFPEYGWSWAESNDLEQHQIELLDSIINQNQKTLDVPLFFSKSLITHFY